MGIDVATRATLAERSEAFAPRGHRAEILFGIIVSLIAAQLDAERDG